MSWSTPARPTFAPASSNSIYGLVSITPLIKPSSTAVLSEASITFCAFEIASAKYPSDSGSEGSANTTSKIISRAPSSTNLSISIPCSSRGHGHCVSKAEKDVSSIATITISSDEILGGKNMFNTSRFRRSAGPSKVK